MKDVSQYGEATLLIEHFKKHPPVEPKWLVDVGASRIDLSNTYNLIKDYDWSGVLIEADPDYRFEELKEDIGYSVVCVEHIAVSDRNGHAIWYQKYPRGHSSLIGPDGIPTRKEVATLEHILNKIDIKYRFGLLSIDAEGMDARILKKFLYDSDYTPEVIIHEKSDDDFSFLSEWYKPLFETKGNMAWAEQNVSTDE